MASTKIANEFDDADPTVVNPKTVIRLPSCLRFENDAEARAYYETFGPHTNPIAPVTSAYGPRHTLTIDSILARVVINPTRQVFISRCQCLFPDFGSNTKYYMRIMINARRTARNGGGSKFSYQGKVIFEWNKNKGHQMFIEREIYDKGFSQYDPVVGKAVRKKGSVTIANRRKQRFA